MCMTKKAIVLWVNGEGYSTRNGMLSPSHEIMLMCKIIWSNDIDLSLYVLGKRDKLAPWFRIAMWRRWQFSLDYQIVQNKMFTHKICFHSCSWRHGFSSLVSVEFCQVQISGTGRSLFQTCSFVCVCARAWAIECVLLWVWSDAWTIL
jgi:hypothetical protein